MHNPATDTRPASIVVADDNPANLHLLTNMLSEHGYTVRPTTDGALALTSAQANPPDLILLDILMPGADGYAICEALKADERTRAVPVIFISALSEPFDKVRAFAAGGVDYVTKPFDAEEVLARVATHVALQRAQRQLNAHNIQLQQEIVERQRVEQALRASEERFRLTFDLSPIGAAMESLDGHYLRVNDMLCHITGYTREELLARHFADITHPEDRENDLRNTQLVVTGKLAEYVTEKRYIRKDGQIAWVQLSVRLMNEGTDRPAYILATMVDVTARKQLENALQTSRAMLRGILDNAPLQISARDLQGHFTLVNKSFWEYVGLARPQDALEKRIEDFFAPSECESIYVTDRQVLATGQPLTRETIVPSSGRPHTWLSTKFPIHDSAGAVTAIGVIAQDITERKEIEQALEHAHVVLFQRIDELSTLNSIAQLLAIVRDLPDVLGTVCETIARLFDAAGALISILDPDDVTLTMRAQFARSAAIPNLVGRVVYLPQPAAELHTTRRHHHRRQDRILDTLHDQLRLLVGHELRLVALQAGARLTGVLAILIEPPDRTLTPTEITLAETIAGQIAVAIENARLYELAQATAVDAERQRFGRDLHDSVVQLIYSMTLLSDAWAAAAVQGTLDDVAGRFRQLGSVSQQALREMRLLIHQLRPPVLKEVGLIGALQRRLEMVEQRLGIATRIAAKGDLAKLSQVVEEQLFAIGQEALNNALRHAGAGAVEVGIELADGSVTLMVHDDGRGFNRAEQPTGMGLITMRERAAAIGGTLEINTALWQGTTVEVAAPAKDDVAEEDGAPAIQRSIGAT